MVAALETGRAVGQIASGVAICRALAVVTEMHSGAVRAGTTGRVLVRAAAGDRRACARLEVEAVAGEVEDSVAGAVAADEDNRRFA